MVQTDGFGRAAQNEHRKPGDICRYPCNNTPGCHIQLRYLMPLGYSYVGEIEKGIGDRIG